MELLQSTDFWYFVSFAIFFGVVAKLAGGKIGAMLDQKIESIQNDIKNAENLRVEAQELLAQYQRKQRDADKEAETILEQAKERAEQIRKKAESDLDEVIERKEAQLSERLKRMEENAKAEIRDYAADLALTATREIIAQSMDKKVNDDLCADAIEQLPANLKS